MSESNPFAPPKAEVADMPPLAEAAPALWNPGAAAAWSLVFTPILGAYLHTRNWEALGQPDKAASSKKWMLGAIAFFILIMVVSFIFPDAQPVDALTRVGGIVLLVSWYYSLGKSQQAFVAARFGKEYPRRGWAKPLLAALGIFVGFFLAMVIVGGLVGGILAVLGVVPAES